MRKILFRGKDSDDVWQKGFYCVFNDKEHRIYTGYAETDCGDYYPDYYTVIPETVGQYTGLTDVNGTKIFEGDIIKADNGHIGFVTFYKGSFVKRCFCHPKSVTSIWEDNETVIGNIHDNPDFLKGD